MKSQKVEGAQSTTRAHPPLSNSFRRQCT